MFLLSMKVFSMMILYTIVIFVFRMCFEIVMMMSMFVFPADFLMMSGHRSMKVLKWMGMMFVMMMSSFLNATTFATATTSVTRQNHIVLIFAATTSWWSSEEKKREREKKKEKSLRCGNVPKNRSWELTRPSIKLTLPRRFNESNDKIIKES